MEPTSKGDLPAWLAMEAQLTEQERALRDRFVDEYLVDQNAYRACLRIGFSAAFAEEYAKVFMKEAYVEQRITSMTQKEVDPDARDNYRNNQIRMLLLKWAHCDHGPTAVQALRQLCSVNGLDAPTRIKQEIEHRGGVMMVPAIASLEDWEKAAVESQQKLTEFARSDVH